MKMKEFIHFLQCFNPESYELWKDVETRHDPVSGDKYIYNDNIIIFDNTTFDSSFSNGVAHIYNFHDEYNNIIKVRSINYVYKPELLTNDDRKDYLGFWRYCTPYKS